MPTPATLILRADGSPLIGTGHVMRCLALAQAWQDRGGHAVLAFAELSPALESRLGSEHVALRRITQTPNNTTAWADGADWVILDGYHFSADLQTSLIQAGHRVLAIDDNGQSTPPAAHLLLNPNLHARRALHDGHAPHTELLLGPRFAPLRREFIHLHPKSAEAAALPVRKLLISLGGADPPNRTLDVLRRAAPQLPDGVQLRVIAGGSNPHLPSLRECLRHHAQAELVVDAPRMAEHYLWADAAVLPASTSCLEAFRCGLPCILIASMDNQREVAAHARALDLAEVVEASHELPEDRFDTVLGTLLHDTEWRVAQSARTARLVDGQGCRRILQAMHLHGARLDPVGLDDACLLWEWANDPEVRRHSFHPEPIPWENHLGWLRSRLAEPDSKFFIARTSSGEAIGQIRLQAQSPGQALIHLSAAPTWRGRGAGARMLQLAESAGFRRLHARVKQDNTASLRMFEAAGFERMDENDGACQFQKNLPLP